MQYLYGFLALVVGLFIEWQTFNIVRTFGHMEWAERWFGSGGTYTAWRLIGILVIIGGFVLFRYNFLG